MVVKVSLNRRWNSACRGISTISVMPIAVRGILGLKNTDGRASMWLRSFAVKSIAASLLSLVPVYVLLIGA
jgi:predicted metallopeptidase